VAAAGHVVAGGSVAAGVLIGVALGAGGLTWCLASRRLTIGQLVGLLLLAQAVVHVSCAWTDDQMSMGAGMIAAHAVATAASAGLLARGEGFLWLLADRVGLRARPLLLGFTALVGRPQPRPVARTRARHDVTLAHTRSERGPPVTFA